MHTAVKSSYERVIVTNLHNLQYYGFHFRRD